MVVFGGSVGGGRRADVEGGGFEKGGIEERCLCVAYAGPLDNLMFAMKISKKVSFNADDNWVEFTDALAD